MTVTWPFMPQQEPTEALEWMTEIITCRSAEQRLGKRPVPRQEWAYRYQLQTTDFGRAKELAKEIGVDECYLPTWVDISEVGAVSASTVTLPIDGTHKGYVSGGKLILWDDDANFEICTIYSVNVGTITINPGTVGAYTNACAAPVKLARFAQEFEAQRFAGNFAECSARFQLVSADNLAGQTGITYVDYLNAPLISDAVSLLGGMTEQYSREGDSLDPGTGVIYRYSPVTWATTSSRLAWNLHTREDLWNRRAWLHDRRGRLKSFWASSWNADVTINSAIGSTDETISIVAMDYGTYFPASSDFVILLNNGDMYGFRATDVDPGLPGSQILTISSALGTTIQVADIAKTSRIILSRFEADRVEVKYGQGGGGSIIVPTVEVPPAW